MSLTGAGMLCVMIDIAAADEAELNRWYDKEHMEERVRIPGFLDSRRFVAVKGRPKYLALYETRSIATFRSATYKKRLADQTDWSRRNLARMRNMHRTVGRLTVSLGFGHGAYVAVVRLDPVAGHEGALRSWLKKHALPPLVEQDAILSAYVLESDSKLSGPVAGVAAAGIGASEGREWLVIVEGTDGEVVTAGVRKGLGVAKFKRQGTARHAGVGVYRVHSAFSPSHIGG